MNKLLAIIKREYIQRVRSRMFLFTTILGPVMLLVFSVVPAFIFNIKAGKDTRVAIVDLTGRLYDRVSDSILRADSEQPAPSPSAGSQLEGKFGPEAGKRSFEAVKAASEVRFQVERSDLHGSLEQTESDLNARVKNGYLDGYLVIPADVLEAGTVQF